MELIAYKDIYDKYKEYLKQKKRFSNCYFIAPEFYDKWKGQKFTAWETEEAFVLIEDCEKYRSLYYMCDSWKWLQEISQLKKESSQLVVSIVQRNEYEFQKPFIESGYPIYKTYQRLKKTVVNDVNESKITVDYCKIEDQVQIKKIMEDTFDPFSDHIPSNLELVSFLEKRQIICIRENFDIKGFIIFEDKGKTSYIRTICVPLTYRKKGIGNRLMQMYFSIHSECRGFTLWYDINNKAAYSLYNKWGYEKENMYNLIFLL